MIPPSTSPGRQSTPWIAAALIALLLPVTGLAFKADVVPNYYIVELEGAPSLRFEGGPVMQLSAGESRLSKSMSATAPELRPGQGFDASDAAVRVYSAHLDRERASVLGMAESGLGRTIEPMHVYRHVINGFSAHLSAEEAEWLSRQAGVKSIEPVQMYQLLDDAGPQWIGANRIWSEQFGTPVANRGEGMVLGLIDSGINWESNYFNDTPEGFVMTNPRGEFFGLCSDPEVECNNKIIGVYDFTSGDEKGRDDDGHGSHVGSTAVGSPITLTRDFGLASPVLFSSSGVAPRASVISYKVCEGGDPSDPNDQGGCPSAALVAALEQAVIDQVDVINFSIGSREGTATPPWAGFGQSSSDRESLLSLRSAGIVPVVAAGNSGPADTTISAPGNVPWVLAVANATHDRLLGGSLDDLSGGVGSAPFIAGAGLNDEGVIRPIVHASDFGNALCGTGEAELGPSCSSNTGESNPFPPGTFNGEIVVCDRGVYGRVEKGANLLAAGAGGMILANTAAQGASTTQEEHCLPTLHIDSLSGDELRQWLAVGSNHQGRISATSRVINSDFGGALANSSGRGPVSGAPNLMKPNLTAPGSNILGAGADGPDSAGFLSGTSMASPHVAGAALLLRHAFPDWSADAVISALETTADAEVVTTSDGSPARVIDGGAGGVRVDRAARIGLYLPVTEAEFLAADPREGGDPGTLNLAGVVSTACPGTCSFERRLRALTSGTWTVTTEGGLDIAVSPASFSLQAGQEVTLLIDVLAGSVANGAWGRGAVILEPASPSLETQRLTVGVRVGASELPQSIALTTDTDRGRLAVDLGVLPELPEAQFPSSALVRPARDELLLTTDPSNDDPFDGSEGLALKLLDIEAGALMLRAETRSDQAPDVDLFVGEDLNGNGLAEEDELVCFSISVDSDESCRVSLPGAGRWWILVQNWTGSGGINGDAIQLDWAILETQNDSSFGVNGPGRHADGPLDVQLFVDQPALRREEIWWAAFGIGSQPEQPTDLGVIAVSLTRDADAAILPTALFNGESRTVTLPPSGRHRGIYVDLPPGVDRLDVAIQGDPDVEADLRLTEFAELEDAFPSTFPASGASLASGSGSASGFQLSADGPQPGRYFIDLSNTSGAERQVDVAVTLSETQRIETRYGLWSPLSRSISQGIEWQRAGLGFLIWYSYDSKGLPVFYVATNAVDEGSSTWSSDLIRLTGGSNNRQHVQTVGQVSLTTISRDQMMFAWRLNGAHGAEIYAPDAPESCPEQNGSALSYTGHWFSPGLSQGGTTVIVYEDGQFYVRYYYDGDGVGRWVAVVSTAAGAFADGFEVWSFQGFCPNCSDEIDPDYQVVGTYQRTFTSENSGIEVLDFVSPAPLNGDILLEVPIEKLSEPIPCTP